MPRKGPAPKRPLIVDPVYGSPLVTQLVNKVLSDGKKSLAERIVYEALEGCRDKTGNESGRKELLIPAGAKYSRMSTTIKSIGQPVTADVYGCSYDIPPYLSTP